MIGSSGYCGDICVSGNVDYRNRLSTTVLVSCANTVVDENWLMNMRNKKTM